MYLAASPGTNERPIHASISRARRKRPGFVGNGSDGYSRHPGLVSNSPAKIEGEGELRVGFFWRRHHWTRCMAESTEAREAATFRFLGVDRYLFVRSSAGMRDVIHASADRARRPRVHDIEDQRCVNRDVGMQAGRRLPRAIADSTHRLRNAAAVAQDDVTVADSTCYFDLDAFDRGIHVAGRACAGGFFAEYVPWFQGMA